MAEKFLLPDLSGLDGMVWPSRRGRAGMPKTEVAMNSRPTWRVLALLAALAGGLALTTTA